MNPLGSVFAFIVNPGSSGEGRTLLSLFLVLLAAKIFAELFERLKQPAVIGEILAGVIIGPYVLGWAQPSDALQVLSDIGVIFLLFTVGLETRPSDIITVGGTSTVVAILGVVLPFVAGFGLLSFWPGHTRTEAIFLGASMVATSVGITARVLANLKLISARSSRVILAAAVIDDIIGLLVLAVASSLAEGKVNYVHIGLTAALAIAFAIFTVTLGARAVRRARKPVDKLRIGQSLLVFALLLCFGLAAVASLIGIAGLVGAFMAGVAISESSEGTELHKQSEALTEFSVPFFLVAIGMKLDPSVFLSPSVILLTIIVIILAALTKLIGCGLGAARLGWRSAVQVGVGMIPRGEVGIVVAQIGLAASAISQNIYAVVLGMTIATTIMAPPLIKLSFRGKTKVGKVEPAPRPIA